MQEAVARFGQALESTHDVSALLGIVIESAMEAVGARGGRVVIVDEQTNTLVEHRRIGTAEELSEDVLPSKIVIGEGVEGLAAQTGHPARCRTSRCRCWQCRCRRRRRWSAC